MAGTEPIMRLSMVEEADYITIKAWFDIWGKFVSQVDFDAARKMFEEEIVGFGTWTDTIEGLDNLIEKQWKSVWPTIKDFRFLTETLRIQVSPDRLFAIAAVVWESTGFHENHEAYIRPGRATVSLRRQNLGTEWKGTHTHLSLCRGVPQTSYIV